MVYVRDKDNNPLMPTENHGYVRVLLKTHCASVVSSKPFTIRLNYDTTSYVQPVTCGIDPGRTNIGIAAVEDDGQCVFSANAETNNKDVPNRMKERKAHRRASRQGDRCVRQRRAKAAKTCFAERKIILPGCKEPITCKYIKNSEARFNNRKRKKGWLTPTARHLLLCHVNLLKKLQKFLPVSRVVLEVNSFAFIALDNPNIQKWEYQLGPLHGKGSVKDAVCAAQSGKCLLCDRGIDHYHHIVPRSKGGSDTLPNIVGLCEHHHKLAHTDEEWNKKVTNQKDGMNKKYSALSVLNQIIPFLVDELSSISGLEVVVTDGRSTKAFRDAHNISKDHHIDAYCIACSALDKGITVSPPASHYELRRFRQHDRAAVARQEERKYYLDGKLVAKNRNKRMEQKDDSLAEYCVAHPDDVGRLKVVKGTAKYKNKNRILPGAIFRVNRKSMILQKSTGLHNGKPDYYVFFGSEQKFRPKYCELITAGGGWRFL